MSTGTREGDLLVDHQSQVVELRLRVTELEGRLALAAVREIDRAAHLQEILNIAQEYGEDSGDDGIDCDACHRILALADSALVLNPSSPTAQALTRLVEAAAELRQLWTGNENVWSKARTADAWGRFVRAVDAYQAARSGRGEGRSPFWASVEELADSVQDIPPERREMSGVWNAARRDQPPAPGPATKETP